MARILAAAIQTAAHDRGSFLRAWPGIASQLRAAAYAGARLAVLPEATLPAYVLGPEPFEEAETSAAFEQCCAIAREHRMVIIAGAARAHAGRVYNSAIVIDADGTVAGAADKHLLWHFDRRWFAPGDRIEPIPSTLGRIGALVCADGRIPTIARRLVDAGAGLLIMPTAWVTSGRDPNVLENVQADLLASVRARENNVPFIAANKCGVERGCVAYCGKSQILDRDGSALAVAAQTEPALLLAEIELGANPARIARLPQPPPPPVRSATRFAIAATGVRDGRERRDLLDAQALLEPGDCAGIPSLGDAEMLDPGVPVGYRLAGHDVLVWKSAMDPSWQQRFARARAVELRIYVIVMDERAGRAYAIDPDGTVLCGTFPGLEIACFTYDPARSAQTMVAPHTDVLDGLKRATLV